MFRIIVLIICFVECVEAKKVLFVGGIHGGKEEIFDQKRKDKTTVLQLYFEAWRQIIEELRQRNIEVDFSTHQFVQGRLSKLPETYDLYIFQNHKFDTSRRIQQRAFLILFEPMAVLPLQFDRALLSRYAKVFSWHDELVQEGRAIKFCYPVRKPFEGETPFLERKKACMIASNKGSSYVHELYSEREKIIRYYKGSFEFDLYGKGWEEKRYFVYRGASHDKMDDLKKYRFVYCLENSCEDNPGYITEKLFDAFAAGTIPIYWGAPNVADYIPTNCYIDYCQFQSLEALDQFLRTFTEEQYHNYIGHIQQFLISEASKRFTIEAFVQIVLPEILRYLEGEK